MLKNQIKQKNLLFILVLLVFHNSTHAGWEGLLNSFNFLQNELSTNQKLALGAGLIAVTSYSTKYLYEKRLNFLKQKRHKERQDQLLPLLKEARNVSFSNFKSKCDELKRFKLRLDEYYEDRNNRGKDKKNKRSALKAEDFHQILDRYFKILLLSDTFERTNWVNQDVAHKLEASLKKLKPQENQTDSFDPYVQKLVLPSGAKVILFGDRHGDIHSLLNSLQDLSIKGYLDKENPFKINDPNVYIGFLGDWTDRGWYGAEVMATMLQLWSANPNNIFLVRGNHEDLSVNQKESINGFIDELKAKFPDEFEKTSEEKLSLVQKITLMYETLPLATFVGCKDTQKNLLQTLVSYFYNNDVVNYALSCHGGVELGYNALPLLTHESSKAFGKLGDLKRKKVLDKICSCSENLKRFKRASENSQKPIISAQDIKKSLRLPEEDLEDFAPTHIKSTLYTTQEGYTTKPKNAGDVNALDAVAWPTVGFLWNDSDPDVDHEKNEGVFAFKGMRAWTIGRTFNQSILNCYRNKYHKVWGVLRGHQHSGSSRDPMMARILNSDDQDHAENKGVGRLWLPENVKSLPATKLWDNFVYTFNVSPNTPYRAAGFDFDTYGILTVQDKFEDWTMETIRV